MNKLVPAQPLGFFISTTTSQAPGQSNHQSHLGGASQILSVGFSYSAILCLLAEWRFHTIDAGAVFMGHVHIFAAFGFDQVINPINCDSHKIRLIVAEIGGGVCVSNGKAEMFREFGEAVNV